MAMFFRSRRRVRTTFFFLVMSSYGMTEWIGPIHGRGRGGAEKRSERTRKYVSEHRRLRPGDRPRSGSRRPSFPLLPADTDSPLGTATAASIGAGALASNRQAPAVPEATVGADLLEPLDAESDLAAELTFHLELLVDDLAEAGALLVAELVDPGVGVDVGRAHHPGGGCRPHSIDALHRDNHPPFAYACYAPFP